MVTRRLKSLVHSLAATFQYTDFNRISIYFWEVHTQNMLPHSVKYLYPRGDDFVECLPVTRFQVPAALCPVGTAAQVGVQRWWEPSAACTAPLAEKLLLHAVSFSPQGTEAWDTGVGGWRS